MKIGKVLRWVGNWMILIWVKWIYGSFGCRREACGHVGSHGIQYGLYEDDEEDYKVDDFWTSTIVQWTIGVYVSA